MATDLIIDMSNPTEKGMILQKIRELAGQWRFRLSRLQKNRTLKQNRYYWPCFVQPFADFLRAQGEGVSDGDAHEILKAKFLTKAAIDHRTGEAMTFSGSTKVLNVAEFNEYLDACAAWLRDFFGIQVPDADIYRQKEPMPASKKAA